MGTPCSRIFLTREFMFYFLQLSLLPNSELGTRPSCVFAKWTADDFSAFSTHFRASQRDVRRSEGAETSGSSSEGIKKERVDIFPGIQKGKVERELSSKGL